jgi:hypothetical protein
MHLFECVSVAEAEKILAESLEIWLQDLPEFDPEGWALPVLEGLDPAARDLAESASCSLIQVAPDGRDAKC